MINLLFLIIVWLAKGAGCSKDRRERGLVKATPSTETKNIFIPFLTLFHELQPGTGLFICDDSLDI